MKDDRIYILSQTEKRGFRGRARGEILAETESSVTSSSVDGRDACREKPLLAVILLAFGPKLA